jgi:hypothetical protein
LLVLCSSPVYWPHQQPQAKSLDAVSIISQKIVGDPDSYRGKATGTNINKGNI